MTMKVVLDTSVLVAALRSRHGYSNKLLQLASSGAVRLLASPALFLEYEEVLGRPEQRAAHGLSSERLNDFFTALADIIEPVRVYIQWRPQLKDADDEMVLETALNGRAAAIITHNLKDFALVPSRFQLRVLRPAELVKEVLGERD